MGGLGLTSGICAEAATVNNSRAPRPHKPAKRVEHLLFISFSRFGIGQRIAKGSLAERSIAERDGERAQKAGTAGTEGLKEFRT
jgi:hypothetical protein